MKLRKNPWQVFLIIAPVLRNLHNSRGGTTELHFHIVGAANVSRTRNSVDYRPKGRELSTTEDRLNARSAPDYGPPLRRKRDPVLFQQKFSVFTHTL